MTYFFSSSCAQSPETELQEAETEDNYEELEYYYQESVYQKIELNIVNTPDLAMLELADTSVWNKIKERRRQTGWYFSPYEIQSIQGLDSVVVRKIIPYLSADVIPGKWKEEIQNADVHYITLRATADNLNSFSGKYRRGRNDFHNLNLSFRKLSASSYRVRGNLWIQPVPKLRILAGHYKMDWGQGLLMGTYAPGKNAEPIRSVVRIPLLDIPWNSSGMHARGLAIRYTYNRRIQFVCSVSSKKDPAVVRDTLLQYWLWQADAKAVMVREDQLSGGAVFKSRKSETGILAQYTQTDVPQKFWSQEKTAASFSLSHCRTLEEKNLAVEIAVVNFKPAASLSMMYPLRSRLEGATNIRALAQGYFSRYMNSFGLSYNSPALVGWYQGLRWYASRMFTISLSYDKMQRAPEKEQWAYNKEETFAMFQVRFSRAHTMIAKWRYRTIHEEAVSTKQHNWQIQQSVEVLPFRLKARMQGAFSEKGQSLAGGGEIELKKSGISFLVGVSFFKIDHYSLKESWYERPVFLSSGFSWLYDDGLHRYLMITYKPARSLTVWLRGFLEEKAEQAPVAGLTFQALYNFVRD